MPHSTQQPISKSTPKQPQPAQTTGKAAGDSPANLENLDRVRDPDGQKAKAAERYGASVGKKPSISANKG